MTVVSGEIKENPENDTWELLDKRTGTLETINNPLPNPGAWEWGEDPDLITLVIDESNNEWIQSERYSDAAPGGDGEKVRGQIVDDPFQPPWRFRSEDDPTAVFTIVNPLPPAVPPADPNHRWKPDEYITLNLVPARNQEKLYEWCKSDRFDAMGK